MRRLSIYLALAVGALLFATGCIITGSVTEVQVPTESINFKTIYVSVRSDNQKFQDLDLELEQKLKADLKRSGLFSRFGEGGLKIYVKVVAFEPGGILSWRTQGEAEVQLKCELQNAEGEVICILNVTGSSRGTGSMGSTQIGRFSIPDRWFVNLQSHALNAASKEIVNYLKKKKGN